MKFKKLISCIIIFSSIMTFTASAGQKSVKVAFVGNLRSGKTAIFKRLFGRGYNPDERRSDTLVCGRKELPFNGDTLMLEIWDTAGLKNYYTEVIEHTKHMNFVFIVHDLSQKYDAKVEAYLTKIYRDVHEKIAADGKIVIIGSKYDLRHNDIVNSSANCGLLERVAKTIPTTCRLTSASENNGIEELIDFIKEKSRTMNLPDQGVDLGDNIRLGNAEKSGCCG